MIRIAFTLLALALTTAQGYASPAAEDVLRSLTALGLDPGAQDRAIITEQITTARADTQDRDWFDASTPRLVEMAVLSQEALRPSSRIRLVEMHRQLLELLVMGDNRALELAAAADPMVEQFEIGVGMTNRDLGWAIMLEAMRRDLPSDPREMQLGSNQAEALRKEITIGFRKDTYGARHFLSRVDAWAFGTIAAWPQMTPDERLLAVSVVTEEAVPPVALIEKVIGAQDVLLWLAGIDIGLTEAETNTYPALVAYLHEGNLAGGVKDLLAERARLLGGAGLAGAGTVQMMMELNYDLLFDNNLSAGGLMGLE
jgi:hypothetical protein